MPRLSSRLAHVLGSSALLFSGFVACTLMFAAQARADRIGAQVDDDGHVHFFTVKIEGDSARHISAVQNSRIQDRDAYTRKLKFTVTNYHPSGFSAPTSTLAGNGVVMFGDEETKNSDPASAVPEPSSLLLMSAGLLGLGTLLRSRLAAKSH